MSVRPVDQCPLCSHTLTVWQQILERRIIPKQPQQGFQSQPHSDPVVQQPAVQHPSKSNPAQPVHANALRAPQADLTQTALAGQQPPPRPETVGTAGTTTAVQQASQEPVQQPSLSHKPSMQKHTSDTSEKLQQTAIPVLLAASSSPPHTGTIPPPPSDEAPPPPTETAPPLPTGAAPPLPTEAAPPPPTAPYQSAIPASLPLLPPEAAGLAPKVAPTLLAAASVPLLNAAGPQPAADNSSLHQSAQALFPNALNSAKGTTAKHDGGQITRCLPQADKAQSLEPVTQVSHECFASSSV